MVTLAPDALVAGYQAATANIRSRVEGYARRVWSGSPSFRDVDIDRIVARIVPVVRAGQVQVAQLTDAYIGRAAVLAGVTWTPGLNVNVVVDYRGVPADVVYRRPANTVYTALSKGDQYPVAVQQGLDRLMNLVGTDLQQSRNRSAADAMSRSGFHFFRRELRGGKNCALCVIASTQRYYRGDLMPIHPACDCGVVPIDSFNDPGQVIDSTTLEELHAKVKELTGTVDRGGRAPDYRNLLVTNTHGELGPTLGWRGQHFTGPNDLPG